MQSVRRRPLGLRLAERKWLLAAFFLMSLLPFAYPSLYWLLILSSVLAMAVFALSYDIMLGQTGILSFGHAACFGLGAYGVYWMTQAGYPFVFAVVVAMLLASLVNVAMGVSLLRIKGVYFAMFTLAFAEVIHLFLEKQVPITGGSTGVTAPRPPAVQDPAITLLFVALFAAAAVMIGYVMVSFYMRRGEHIKALIGLAAVLVIGTYGIYNFGTLVQVLMNGPRGAIWAFTINTYLLSVVILVLAYYLVSRLTKSRLGSVLIAVRENEERTKMLGYNTSMYKMASLAIAGLLAGLAGARPN
ncbi:MAG: branched-chain amino acid ABC transporter permease, partial [Thaumarchaeota archaeon]|nr:branched-chain amino acid ABC transporter permease [Nitrososphaerota archaeon]